MESLRESGPDNKELCTNPISLLTQYYIVDDVCDQQVRKAEMVYASKMIYLWMLERGSGITDGWREVMKDYVWLCDYRLDARDKKTREYSCLHVYFEQKQGEFKRTGNTAWLDVFLCCPADRFFSLPSPHGYNHHHHFDLDCDKESKLGRRSKPIFSISNADVVFASHLSPSRVVFRGPIFFF